MLAAYVLDEERKKKEEAKMKRANKGKAHRRRR